MEKSKEYSLKDRQGIQYFVRLGLTLVVVVLVCGLLALLLFNVSGLKSALSKLFTVISPIIYGGVFAFLMNPILKFSEKFLIKWLSKGNRPERTVKRVSRGLGIVISAIVFLAVVYAVGALVIPQVVASAEDLINNKLNDYYLKATALIESIVGQNASIKAWYDTNKEKIDILGYAKDWFMTLDIAQFFSNAIGTVFGFAKGLLNIIIGFVVAIYLLIAKERFQAQAKKLTVAVFRQKTADRLLELARRTNRIFGGFIVGKIIDSLIIGVLCYLIMLVLRLPYAVLISAVVGITNIIPFFGPLVGVGFGTLLILLVNPLQALTFLIAGVVLQQLDGNVIGPKILGDRLGISDFWILVSITVFGGLFGFAGMLLGVPVFTLIYTLVGEAVNKSLEKKAHPTDTDSYYSILSVADLERHRIEFENPTVFYSEDTYDTEYDPDDDFEYSDLTEDDI